MNVQELIDKLSTIEDKELDVRLCNKFLNPNDNENYWLTSVEIHDKGYSGYEVYGEVMLHV